MAFNLLRSLKIRGVFSFLFLSDSKTVSESENIIKHFWLLSQIMLSVRSIIKLSFGKRFS